MLKISLLLVILCVEVTLGLKENLLACELKARHAQCEAAVDSEQTTLQDGVQIKGTDERRVVAIGDVHGAYTGLLEVLYNANITVSKDDCAWRKQGTANRPEDGTVLVQMGDLVDRGPQAWEALKCLRSLQKNAHLVHSKVVRLLGSEFDTTSLEFRAPICFVHGSHTTCCFYISQIMNCGG